MAGLLAVDLGLKAGFALFGRDGRLRWYRSKHYSSPSQFKRGMFAMLREVPEMAHLVLEGGGPLADIWIKEADRRRLPVLQLAAEEWREVFLWTRERRSGRQAKQNAREAARRVAAWSGLPGPTSMNHNAAEAVMAGFLGLLRLGWLESIPLALRR